VNIISVIGWGSFNVRAFVVWYLITLAQPYSVPGCRHSSVGGFHEFSSAERSDASIDESSTLARGRRKVGECE
jgi:hypothetical protein